MEVNENGPLAGLVLSREDASKILKKLNKEVAALEQVGRGFNNLAYYVHTTDGAQYVVRLTGCFWKHFKTESEVAVLQFVNKHTSIPVPEVHCWDAEGQEMGFEYIVMEMMPGRNLWEVWPQLLLEEKLHVTRQVADYFIQMKKCSFPAIGRFRFARKNESTGIVCPLEEKDIVIGEYSPGRGTFASVMGYMVDLFESQLGELAKDIRFASRKEQIPHIREWVTNNISEENLEIHSLLEDVPIVLSHGDFNLRNILVVGTTITGVVDWEWGGAFPLDKDWNDSFDFVREGEEDFHYSEHSPICAKLFMEELTKADGNVEHERFFKGRKVREELYLLIEAIAPWQVQYLGIEETEKALEILNESLPLLLAKGVLYK